MTKANCPDVILLGMTGYLEDRVGLSYSRTEKTGYSDQSARCRSGPITLGIGPPPRGRLLPGLPNRQIAFTKASADKLGLLTSPREQVDHGGHIESQPSAIPP